MTVTKSFFPFITSSKYSGCATAILCVATVLVHYYTAPVDPIVRELFETYIDELTIEDALLLLETQNVREALTKEQLA